MSKLKTLSRTLKLVPQTFPPMSQPMQRIARQTDRQAPAPAPADSGLGHAIEKLISDEVSRRVDEAMAEQQRQQQFNRPAPVTDFRQLTPVPRTQPPKASEITFQRDELGRIAMVDMGTVQFRVQRGALGQIVRMIPADDAPMPPAIEPLKLKQAREYQLLPRKLFGNDPE